MRSTVRQREQVCVGGAELAEEGLQEGTKLQIDEDQRSFFVGEKPNPEPKSD